MLYIVATPIGNLSEITFRAVEVLKSADAILCEDTRRTRVLADRYGITAPLVSYHKYSEREKAEYVAERLEKGENLALVSDAGMPLVSDPGKVLVDELVRRGLDYTVISGPCAAVNALVLSGLDTSAFVMCGFLPEGKKDRREYIRAYSSVPATLIFYSPPHDVRDDIAFLFSELGDRKLSVVREISKVHEEVVRGTLGSPPEFNVRGEFVLVVEGAKREKKEAASVRDAALMAARLVAEGVKPMDAVKSAAAECGLPKSAVYKEYQEIRQ